MIRTKAALLNRSLLITFARQIFVLAMFFQIVHSRQTANAATLFINQASPLSGYAYGLPNFDDLSAELESAFGGSSNITVASTMLGDVTAYDALWINMRNPGTSVLDPAELANLSNFIATGKRVVIVGENTAWSDWNNSFLALLGGSFSGSMTGNENLSPIVSHPVSAGMLYLKVGDDGIAIGGTSLFSQNVITLWGTQSNVITVLGVSPLGAC